MSWVDDWGLAPRACNLHTLQFGPSTPTLGTLPCALAAQVLGLGTALYLTSYLTSLSMVTGVMTSIVM